MSPAFLEAFCIGVMSNDSLETIFMGSTYVHSVAAG